MIRDNDLNGLEHYERFLDAQRFEPGPPMTTNKKGRPMAFDDLGKGLAAVCNPMTRDKTTNPGDVAVELETLAEIATPGPWYQSGPPWFDTGSVVLQGNQDLHAGCFVLYSEAWASERDHEGCKLSSQDADANLIRAYRNHHAEIIAALRAAGEVGRLREALGFDTPRDAYDNLLGASLDLENSNGNDKVTQNTIKRVLGQLAAARRAIAGTRRRAAARSVCISPPPTKGTQNMKVEEIVARAICAADCQDGSYTFDSSRVCT